MVHSASVRLLFLIAASSILLCRLVLSSFSPTGNSDRKKVYAGPSPMERIRGDEVPKIEDYTAKPLFRRTNDIVGTLAYAHVLVEIDLQKIQESLTTTCKCRYPLNSTPKAVAAQLRLHFLNDICDEHENFLDDQITFITDFIHATQPAFNDSNPESRPKRAAGLILVGAAIMISSINSFYNTYQIAQIQESLKSLNPTILAVKDLARSVDTLNVDVLVLKQALINHFNGTNKFFKRIEGLFHAEACATAIFASAHRLNKIQAGLNSLAQGFITPNLIRPKTVRKTLIALSAQLLRDDYKLTIDSATQFFQLPTSYSLNDKNVLIIYVHVPLKLSGTTLELYEYLPLPIHLFQNNSYYYQIVPDAQYIASHSARRDLRELTASQIARCRMTAGLYYCEHQNILYDYSHGSCITALYKNQIEKIRDTCKFKVTNLPLVVQLDNFHFIIFSPTSIQITFNCRGGKNSITKSIQIHGLKAVYLPAGCSANCDHFYFAAQTNINISLPSDVALPAFNLSSILLLNDDEIINDKISEALIHMTEPIRISDAIRYLQEVNVSGWWIPTAWTNTLLSIISAILFALGAYFELRRPALRAVDNIIKAAISDTVTHFRNQFPSPPIPQYQAFPAQTPTMTGASETFLQTPMTSYPRPGSIFVMPSDQLYRAPRQEMEMMNIPPSAPLLSKQNSDASTKTMTTNVD